MSIPKGHLPISIESAQSFPMEIGKEEHWRLRLLELMSWLGISQREFADQVHLDPSYVSRLRYKVGKKGRKNLGLDTMAAIRTKFNLSAGWFDLPLGSELPSLQTATILRTRGVKESPSGWTQTTWPFIEVTTEQYSLLTMEEKSHIESDILIRIKGRAVTSKQYSPAPRSATA
jgi:transcriptional regulator with XRE-family HTH domain